MKLESSRSSACGRSRFRPTWRSSETTLMAIPASLDGAPKPRLSRSRDSCIWKMSPKTGANGIPQFAKPAHCRSHCSMHGPMPCCFAPSRRCGLMWRCSPLSMISVGRGHEPALRSIAGGCTRPLYLIGLFRRYQSSLWLELLDYLSWRIEPNMDHLRTRKNAFTSALVICGALLLAATAAAQEARLAGVPARLTWKNSPSAWHIDSGRELKISAGKKTDWFVDPFDGRVDNTAPILFFVPGPDYVLNGKVNVSFRSKWDAGALMVWADDHHWSKLSF